MRENTRAWRRHKSLTKAKRKAKISKEVYGLDWCDNLHQYSKNKVHCSCNLCRFRPVWDPDAKPISDCRKLDAMKFSLEEYRRAVLRRV